MPPRSLTIEELLDGPEPTEGSVLGGAALVKAYWTLKGRAQELGRQQAFWAATNEALQDAYHELAQRTRELHEAREELLALNRELEQRVATQVVEIVARAQEVEALNVQLQLKVQERSRELRRALAQLQAGGGADELHPGEMFAERVEISGILGRGGMGVVYLGRDLLLRKPVALKLLRRAVDPVALERFLAEVTAVASISHPGVVRTLHVDITPGGQLYHLMEYVEGITLARRLVRAPLEPTTAAVLFARLAAALAAAHEAGVVHRDIKPSNIILCSSTPEVRILDFGISKLFNEHAPGGELTRADELVGTPRYMSPEQITSPTRVTASADVYSLGIVLYEAVSGELPYDAQDVSALFHAHVHDPPRDLLRDAPAVPAALAQWVARCLDKDPGARPSARALAQALQAIAGELPRVAPDAEDWADPATVMVLRSP